jgi:hypothetical protein
LFGQPFTLPGFDFLIRIKLIDPDCFFNDSFFVFKVQGIILLHPGYLSLILCRFVHRLTGFLPVIILQSRKTLAGNCLDIKTVYLNNIYRNALKLNTIKKPIKAAMCYQVKDYDFFFAAFLAIFLVTFFHFFCCLLRHFFC